MANIEAPSSRDSAEADITIDKSLILNLINQGKYEDAKRNLLVIIKKDEEMFINYGENYDYTW